MPQWNVEGILVFCDGESASKKSVRIRVHSDGPRQIRLLAQSMIGFDLELYGGKQQAIRRIQPVLSGRNLIEEGDAVRIGCCCEHFCPILAKCERSVRNRRIAVRHPYGERGSYCLTSKEPIKVTFQPLLVRLRNGLVLSANWSAQR